MRRYRFHNHLCRQNIENRFTRNKISISSQSHREIWNENKTIHCVVDPSRDTDSEAPGNRSSTWSVRLPKLVALSEAVLAQLSTTTMKQNEREQLKWNSFVIAKYWSIIFDCDYDFLCLICCRGKRQRAFMKFSKWVKKCTIKLGCFCFDLFLSQIPFPTGAFKRWRGKNRQII